MFLRFILSLALCQNLFGQVAGIRSRCYDEMRSELRCFDLWPPYTNTNFHLPASPSDQNIQFKLFTSSNPGSPQMLQERNENSFINSNFDSSLDTKIIVHGFTDSSNNGWIPNMVSELLQNNVNVIAVDWKAGAKGPNYFQAAANTRVVGAQIASLVMTAESSRIGASRSKFHIIGHSLGSHIAGYAGDGLGGQLGRISALDPAAPLFENYDEDVRIDKNDAQFVDVIHTDAVPLHEAGAGMQVECGHVDFYPNGGHDMPGCSEDKFNFVALITGQISALTDDISCSHNMAPKLFTASINDNDFQSYPCNKPDGACQTCAAGCNNMGYKASPAHRGVYVTTTGATYPY